MARRPDYLTNDEGQLDEFGNPIAGGNADTPTYIDNNPDNGGEPAPDPAIPDTPVHPLNASDPPEPVLQPTSPEVPPQVLPPQPPVSPVTPPAPTGGIPANGDMGQLIATRLHDLFSQPESPDINDPSLAASRVQNQRNFENQRAILAERAGVEGTGDSGGFDTELLGLGQQRGEADLAAVGAAGQDRRQNIIQALQLASQNQQGNNNLGLSYAQLEALLNAQALQQELAGIGAA